MGLFKQLQSWWSGAVTCRAWTLIPSQTEKTLATLVFIDHQGEKHRWVVGSSCIGFSKTWIKNMAPIKVDALVGLSPNDFGVVVYAPSRPGEKIPVVQRGVFLFDSFKSMRALCAIGPDEEGLKMTSLSDMHQIAFDVMSFFVPNASKPGWFIEDDPKWGVEIYDARYRSDGTYESATLYMPATIHDGLTGNTWKGLLKEGQQKTARRHAVVTREPITGQQVLFILSPYGFSRRFARSDAHPDRWATTEPFWNQLVNGSDQN